LRKMLLSAKIFEQENFPDNRKEAISMISKIDRLIEEVTEQLANDTIMLVNICSEQGEPLPGAPFGKGPRQVLDKVLEMGKNGGFYVKDHGVGVVSIAMEDTQPDLGIWLHGDVVPAGSGWTYPPYDATRYKNCIIGRGVTDNKGQLAAIWNLFVIFKKLGIKLNYNPAIYVGSNEESGMYDMTGTQGNPDAKGFANVCTPPRLSLVPDSGFPISHGARGMTSFRVRSKTPLHGFTLTAGQKENPGLATADFDSTDILKELCECEINGNTVTAFSPPQHTSRPDPKGNMITKLTSALLDAGIVPQEDRHILEFFRVISLDTEGKALGIYQQSKEMPCTTVYAQSIDCKDGYCELEMRVRFPIEITYEKIRETMKTLCEEKGFDLIETYAHPPYLYDKGSQIVQTLTEVSRSVTGDDKEPYITGSTYAHYLPNAYAFGTDGNLIPEEFPQGHGGAHSIDEVVSLDRLKRAMRIYARALLALNDMDW